MLMVCHILVMPVVGLIGTLVKNCVTMLLMLDMPSVHPIPHSTLRRAASSAASRPVSTILL